MINSTLFKALLTIFVSLLCGNVLAQDSSNYERQTFNYAAPDKLESLQKISIWATEYYVHQTKSEGNIPYLDDMGNMLGFFSDTCDFCTACLEGTVFIEDSLGNRTVLNYSSKSRDALVNCRSCGKFKNSSLNVEAWGKVRWKLSSGFGEGVLNYKLVPYRTIAVDNTIIKYGSVVYIPSAKGTAINRADGSMFLHDGYFFAGDTGGAIKKNHIDVFTGTDDSHPFEFVKSSPKQEFDCYFVDDKELISALSSLHFD